MVARIVLRECYVFSHIFFSVSNFEQAFIFYSKIMESLNVELRFYDPEKPWAGWHSAGGQRPLFVICKPYDGQPHHPGNGQMVAFSATDRHMVDLVYKTALSLGGSCEGLPGLRCEYHDSFYGAYFRDPDGNKICVVCHTPDPVT
jgi:catechol 2,3-dioxygenase-like lactoylglutathione lyase family enzyme